MVLGVSGQLSPSITGGNLSLSSFGVSGHLWMPVGLSGVALVLGTAFGAYWFARKFAIRFKWTGIVSSVIVGVVINQFWVLMTVALAVSLGWLMAYEGNRARWNRPPDDNGRTCARPPC